jgi:fucose 4-O-acetylase-like acetyltransferase
MNDDRYLQTLRGLACLLLVAYHVVGDDASRGLRLSEGWLRDGNDALACLRMPLFTFLSGIVYGLRPLQGDIQGFLRVKAQRLLLPMLVVGTLHAWVQSLGVGVNAVRFQWSTLHIEPVEHFWFLEALFWVFLIVGSLDSVDRRRAQGRGGLRLLNEAPALAALWLAAVGLQLLVDLPRTLGLEGASYLLPYFVAGLAVVRLGGLSALTAPRQRAWMVVLAGLAAALALAALGQLHANPPRRTLTMLAAGTSLCLLILALRPRTALLSRVGAGSFAIFLTHVFFTAGSRLLLERAGVKEVSVLFLSGLCCGIVGPLLLQLLARRSPLLALLLLGESARHTVRPRTQAC